MTDKTFYLIINVICLGLAILVVLMTVIAIRGVAP